MKYKKCSKCNKLYSLKEIENHYLHTNDNICCNNGYLEDIADDFDCSDCYYFIMCESWFDDSADDLWCNLLQDWIIDNIGPEGGHKDCPILY